MATQPIVLLAEDDAFLRRMYAKKFEQAGIPVLLAEDGEQALAYATERMPSLILLDILMPKMDGFEVLAELKKDARLKAIPVVLLTNLSEAGDVARAKQMGASEYLVKAHFLPSEVIAAARKYLAAEKKA
ncbi:MAG: response regulator [bacterium]|nr:response regulator [bacterium]